MCSFEKVYYKKQQATKHKITQHHAKSFNVNSFAYLVILHAFLSFADLFQNQLFQKIISGIQSVSNSFDPDQARKMSGLIWVKTVCKGYLQMTLVVKELYNQTFFSHFCRSITRSYYRNSVGVLIVFDITKRASFESLPGWLSEAKFHIEPHQAVYMIIGHKADCDAERQVSSREGSQFAKVNGLKYMETSAKNGKNVEDCFLTIAKDIYHLLEEGKVKMEPGWDGIKPGFARNDEHVHLQEGESESKGCCS